MRSRTASVRGAVLVSTITGLCACGGGAAGEGSASLPEAQGSVRSERQGDQLVLDIRIEPKAAPGELDPKATVYVAWAKPSRGGPARNLGALALSGDQGELRARIPAEELSLIITAEPGADVATPNGPTVLWAYVPRAGAARAAATRHDRAAAEEAGTAEPAAAHSHEHTAPDAASARLPAAGDGDGSVELERQPPGAGTAEPCDCDPRTDAGVPCPAVRP